MKRIDNNIAGFLKSIVNQELKKYKHISLDSYYQLPSGHYFFELTVVHNETSSFVLQERKQSEENIFQISYIPKICFERNINSRDEYLFKRFPYSLIVKDENRLLVNLKSAVTFFMEKHKTLIFKKEIDEIRWLLSNYIDAVDFGDSKYLRYKIYEGFIELYNYFTPDDYIPAHSLPVLFLNPGNHFFLSELIKKEEMPSSDFQQEMIRKLEEYGGLLRTIDSKASFFRDEVVIVFKYKDLDLDLFLENVFFRFFTITKKITAKFKRFYWEKTMNGQFCLYLNADQDFISKEIIPELMINLGPDIKIRQISDISTVYDLFQQYYFTPLHKLSEYVLELKTEEYVSWNNNMAVSYSIEFYLCFFIKSGFLKKEFIEFNKYLSQKWQLMLLSDEELISDEYFTISEAYNKFERLYSMNEKLLIDNFADKIDHWITDGSFEEEIMIINKSMELFEDRTENNFIPESVLCDSPDKQKFNFAEGFLFKAFGVMGMDLESKVYITYVINKLSNES